MKKAIVIFWSLLTIIPYAGAYALAYLFSMKNREDMLTPAEWLALYRDIKDVFKIG